MKNKIMKLNTYEMIYILKPDINDSINLNLVNYYQSLIQKNGGKNVVTQHLGRRHLSYNILHYYDGIYVLLNYNGQGSLVKSIEKHMRLNDKVLRYLTLKV